MLNPCALPLGGSSPCVPCHSPSPLPHPPLPALSWGFRLLVMDFGARFNPTFLRWDSSTRKWAVAYTLTLIVEAVRCESGYRVVTGIKTPAALPLSREPHRAMRLGLQPKNSRRRNLRIVPNKLKTMEGGLRRRSSLIRRGRSPCEGIERRPRH